MNTAIIITGMICITVIILAAIGSEGEEDKDDKKFEVSYEHRRDN